MATESAVMANVMRAALPGYGGAGGGGNPADIIRAYRTSTGAISLAKKRQKEELGMRKTALAAQIKSIDAQIANAAAQLGLSKEQLAQRIKEFDVTTAATKERFDVTTAFNEKQFEWQKQTQPTYKQSGAIKLAGMGLATLPQSVYQQYGVNPTQKATGVAPPASELSPNPYPGHIASRPAWYPGANIIDWTIAENQRA